MWPAFLSTFHQRILGSRRRSVVSVVALTALLTVSWCAFQWWQAWPVRAVLQTPGDTWPLAFSPDSRTFATSSPNRVTLWDTQTGLARAVWDGFNEQHIYRGAFSPDGRTFAAALFDAPRTSRIALIDINTGRAKLVVPTRHAGIHGLVFTDGGLRIRALLADSSANRKTFASWDVATGEQTSSAPLSCPTASCEVDLSPDGRLLAVAPFSGTTVRVWDFEKDRELATLSNPSTTVRLGRGLAFSADGRTLAISRKDGSFEIWDVPTRRLKAALRGHTDDYESYGLCLAPDGRSLASRGEYLRPSTFSGALQFASSRALFGARWRPGSEVIVVDLKTGRRLARAAGAVHAFYSPDSATIATYDSDACVRLRPTPRHPGGNE